MAKWSVCEFVRIKSSQGCADLPRTARRETRAGPHRHAGRVVRRNPDVIIASWCGKAVRKERIAARVEWNGVAAVRDGQIYEIKSAYILQLGPAALTEGQRQLHGILSQARMATARAG